MVAGLPALFWRLDFELCRPFAFIWAGEMGHYAQRQSGLEALLEVLQRPIHEHHDRLAPRALPQWEGGCEPAAQPPSPAGSVRPARGVCETRQERNEESPLN
jgi:hypothetical protein